MLSLEGKSRDIKKQNPIKVKEDIYVKLYLGYKKIEHVVDLKVMLFGCETTEKLFSDNQKYFLELKRQTKLCSTKLEEMIQIIRR